MNKLFLDIKEIDRLLDEWKNPDPQLYLDYCVYSIRPSKPPPTDNELGRKDAQFETEFDRIRQFISPPFECEEIDILEKLGEPDFENVTVIARSKYHGVYKNPSSDFTFVLYPRVMWSKILSREYVLGFLKAQKEMSELVVSMGDRADSEYQQALGRAIAYSEMITKYNEHHAHGDDVAASYDGMILRSEDPHEDRTLEFSEFLLGSGG